MPLPFIAAGAVTSAIAIPLLVKIALAFGISITTFVGLNAAKDEAFELIRSNFSALPVELLGYLGVLRVDVYVTLIFSAYTAKLIIMGVSNSGVLTKFGMSSPG